MQLIVFTTSHHIYFQTATDFGFLNAFIQINKFKLGLQKRTLEKLIIDSCTKKTPFSFNSQLYQQIDRVSMESLLGPTLADIIMTAFEDAIIKPLIDSGVLKFYSRFVDDTMFWLNRLTFLLF